MPAIPASGRRPVWVAEPLLHLGRLLVALDRALMGASSRRFANLARSRALVTRCWPS
jgi:hypothetical protein